MVSLRNKEKNHQILPLIQNSEDVYIGWSDINMFEQFSFWERGIWWENSSLRCTIYYKVVLSGALFAGGWWAGRGWGGRGGDQEESV